jgi:hypothetical protein
MDLDFSYYPECNLKLIQTQIFLNQEKINKLINKKDTENEAKKIWEEQQKLLITLDKCKTKN